MRATDVYNHRAKGFSSVAAAKGPRLFRTAHTANSTRNDFSCRASAASDEVKRAYARARAGDTNPNEYAE